MIPTSRFTFKNVEVLDANEGAFIVGNQMISQNSIELRAQEGGKIKVGQVDFAKIKTVTIVEASDWLPLKKFTLLQERIFEGRISKPKKRLLELLLQAKPTSMPQKRQILK